ncbi:MAG: agmatine deiminase family protein [Cytophagales bacterium]|nr:agmatine deiminase family protein [Cytophagales bacterium]
MSLIRLPAEWEPQSFVQFTFPHRESDWADTYEEVLVCFISLIHAVSQYQDVLVVCHNMREVSQYFGDAARARIRLVELPSNDTWARDHGGITVWQGDQLVVQNYFFNGWGLKFPAQHDNLLTGRLYEKGYFGKAALHTMDLVLEGGGLESDGQGTLLTTADCLLSPNRNPHLSRIQIEDKLKQYLGVQRILWLEHGYLAGDDTDSHIDTLARFCDPQTIAYVQCTDPRDEHYEALTHMEDELRAFRTAQGQAYRLVPLPMPGVCLAADGHRLPATYANFLIINGAVLVPQYQVPQDEAALEQLQLCFPDRAVLGLDCRPLIEQHGSLHCVTMQYPKGL